MTKTIGFALVVAVALVTAVSGADKTATPAGKTDWNQWLGPNRNGIAPESPRLADQWAPEGPVMVWKSAENIPGGAKGDYSNFGSPVVANGKVYLFVHDLPGSADVVFCLDANNGKTLWKTSFPGFPQGCYSSTPYVGEGKVYVVGSKSMYCLDAQTGKAIWKTACLGNSVSSSPALVDGVLVVSTGIGKFNQERELDGKGSADGDWGLFKGFDAASGKELWACPEASVGIHKGKNQGSVNSSAGVWVTDKGPRIITNTGKLTCVNPKNGKAIWQGDEQALYAGTPTIVGDLCITGPATGKMAGYRLRPDKVEKLFETGAGDRGSSFLLYDRHVYANCMGMLRCLDLSGNTLWQKTFGGKISTPVIADGKLFWVSDDKGEILMANATPTMPEKFYVASIPVLEFTTPAICGGRMYLRLKDGVACYDLTKPPPGAATAAKDPVTIKDPAPSSVPASKALITFVDVSPSYPWDKESQLKPWPPENQEEASALDWATNKELSADGKINFREVQDARQMSTKASVVYARVVLEAAAPGKLALSMSIADTPGRPSGLNVFVNGKNVLRQDVHHGAHKPHEELVVDLVAGKNTLLFRDSVAGGEWFLQVQAKALNGLVVKQVAAARAGATNTRRAKP